MSDQPARTRTRTRSKPAAHSTETEQRTGGATTSVSEKTEHKPEKTVNVLNVGGGLLARVTVRDGVTLNMGDYNSFRRDIGLELDIPLGPVEDLITVDGNLDPDALAIINTAADRVQDWVVDRVEGTMEEAEEIMGGA